MVLGWLIDTSSKTAKSSGNHQISELTWYKDNWELLKADKVKIKELLNTWMDEADEESEKKAKEEKEQESELTWYKDNWELWKSEEDKAKKQLITRLEEAEEEIKNLETTNTRSQATSAIAGSGDDSGLEKSTVTETTVCNCSQSLELETYHQEQEHSAPSTDSVRTVRR